MPVIEAAGLRWYVDPGDNDDGLGPEHEAGIEKLVLDLLPPVPRRRGAWPQTGGVLLDVGAHVGHYTLRAAAAGHRVIAVEANPETAGRLLANAVLNSLDGKVRVIPHPAWDEDLPMGYHDGGRVRNGSGQARPDPAGWLFSVVLDDVLGPYPIDVVKIDTEGAELHVLRGLRATLRRCRPLLWIEDHYWLGEYSSSELAGLLAELGYSCELGGEWSGLTYRLCRPVGS